MQRVIAIFIVIVFIISVMFWISAQPASGADVDADAGCRDCHAKELSSKQSRLFVHAPYRDGACGVCHVQGQGPGRKEVTPEVTVVEPSASIPTHIRSVDVDWIQDCYQPSRHIILPVETTEIQGKLVVEIWDQCRDEHQYIVPLPPLEQLELLPTHEAAPFDLSKVTLRRDPIYSDTLVLRCNSSVPLRGKIYLQHADDPGRVVETGSVYQTEIEVSISSLERDTSYSLYLEVHDVSGRTQRSQVYEFDLAHTSAFEEAPRSGGCTLETDMALYRGDCSGVPCYFFAVEASQPITLSVGTLKSVEPVATSLRGVNEHQGGLIPSKRPDYHPDMAESRFTNYSACRACHPDFFGPMSHPVDIVPPVGMKVSEELHLLPDGRISCMTCHEIHAGDDHYRLRFKSRQKLCNSCHENY